LNILFLGDVFGQPGRDAVVRELPGLIDEFAADFVIANGRTSPTARASPRSSPTSCWPPASM